MAQPSGPGLPSPSSPPASVLFAAGGASSSHIPLVYHCLQLWPGLSHFLPFFCPTSLLCPSDRSAWPSSQKGRERKPSLQKAADLWANSPRLQRRGYNEELLHAASSPLGLATGPLTTEAGTLQKETHSHCGAPVPAAHSINLFDCLSWFHLLFPSSRYLTAAPSPWPDPKTPLGRRQGKSLASVARCLRGLQEDLWRAALSLYRVQQCAPRKQC